MNIEEFIPIKKEESEINQMSPLVWAYVGDCVYELYIRTYLVDNTSLKPHKLHIESIKYEDLTRHYNIEKQKEDSQRHFEKLDLQLKKT